MFFHFRVGTLLLHRCHEPYTLMLSEQVRLVVNKPAQ
jgi:hypothetical protein